MAFFFFKNFSFLIIDYWLWKCILCFSYYFHTSIANMTTKDICEFLKNLCFDKDAVQKIIIDFNGFQTTPLTSTKMNFNHLQDQRDIHHGSSIRAYLEYIWCLNCFDPQVSTRFTTVWGCMYHSCQNAWKPQRLQNSFTSCVNNRQWLWGFGCMQRPFWAVSWAFHTRKLLVKPMRSTNMIWINYR